jgi:septal ring factor EnvC (AmiA/AmiB activator)
MTLVGKIFTVLIFVMSLVFMSFSVMVFATHKNWKAAEAATSAKLGTEKTLTEGLKTKLAELEMQLAIEQASRRSVLASLQTKLVRAETAVGEKQGELDKLFADHAQVAEAAKMAETRLEALTTEVGGLRDTLRNTQKDRDEQFDKVVSLTDQFNQMEGLRLRLDERNTQLAQQVSRMKMVMDAKGLRETDLVSHIPPPVEGLVLAISDKDLIEISLGADDGLKEGHTLDVYRGNTYLGRVTIRRTSPDRAVGQIMRELQRGQIRKGDHVTTKLS